MLRSVVRGHEGLAGSGVGFDELPQAYQVRSDPHFLCMDRRQPI